MIVVHHLHNSRSQRILWLLEELGLPHEIKRYQRDPKTMLAPAELKKIHPLGKSPVITDGDYVIAESGAIIEYLLEGYGQNRLQPPTGSQEKILFRYFLHYAEGSAMPPLLLSLIFTMIPKSPMPFFMKPVVKVIANKVNRSFVNPQLKLHFDFLENHLSKHLWFAGNEFTAADIQMSYPVEASFIRDPTGSDRPYLRAYLDRIHARPSYGAALRSSGDQPPVSKS